MIGGRGATLGTPTTAIVAVDVARKRGPRRGARCDRRAPTSPPSPLGAHILVAGGKAAAGTVATVSRARAGRTGD